MCKQQVLAIRPEGMPSLRPSSISFVNRATKSEEFGLKGKKEFLETEPEKQQLTRVCLKHTCVCVCVCT